MYYRLVTTTARENCCRTVHEMPDGWIVVFKPPKRTLEQNAKLWAMLHDIAKQICWYGEWLTPEEWKDVFTASLKKSHVVRGIDGGFVICGQSTSKLSKAEFSELIELIYAFGSERDVQWSDEARRVIPPARNRREIDITPPRPQLPYGESDD